MLDFLGNLKWTHYCGGLRAADAGHDVVIMGWVARRRDLGNLLFLDVRDRSGIVQVVFNKETQPEAHAKAEQEVLYSRMENSPNEDSRHFALEGTSEHGLIEQQVQKLSGMGDAMSDAWAAEFKVLEDLIDHHVDEEEDTGFGCARDDFETEELEAMRDEFQRRKQGLMLSAHD